MNLKQILDMATVSTGMLAPTSWIGSNNAANQQVVQIANMSVLSLREHCFQAQVRIFPLIETYNPGFDIPPLGVATPFAGVKAYSVPADYLQFVPDTAMDFSTRRLLDFPSDPSEWSYLSAGGVDSAVVLQARFYNNALQIMNPPSSLKIKIEYITKYCVVGATTGPKELFSDDSDTCLFDDLLLMYDIKWRYKKEKGFDDWQADLEIFRKHLNSVLGRDRGAKTIEPDTGIFFPGPQVNEWVSE